ncbi:MAG: hypothetical protein OEW21_14690 [Betaproteobacteria bacterium]|nr:hypothetical protein [Betaproteobacteria bacterium]
MPLWKRFWLLFSAIWVAIAGLNVVTILVLGDNPPAKALTPVLFMVAVPALGYVLAWIFFGRGRSEGGGRH